jgi:hypothetical protein
MAACSSTFAARPAAEQGGMHGREGRGRGRGMLQQESSTAGCMAQLNHSLWDKQP